ncbi:MAG: hypothetical protein KatS3mg032_1809 [Cyclobacteriaceae bacterium]|nr:MAG: hypothetical protein KatS3mg032_1809 [Cyclobacteriaceae bacterium]
MLNSLFFVQAASGPEGIGCHNARVTLFNNFGLVRRRAAEHIYQIHTEYTRFGNQQGLSGFARKQYTSLIPLIADEVGPLR